MQVGVVAATIVQVGGIGNQGWSRNLQRFEAHYPPSLKVEGETMVASHCFRLVRKDTSAIDKRKESQPSSSSRKKQKTSTLHCLRDRTVATRAKAEVNHSGVGDTSGLLASHGRERVSIITSLDTLDGISLKGRDPRFMGHHSPNHQWDMHRRSLLLLTPAWARGKVSVPSVTQAPTISQTGHIGQGMGRGRGQNFHAGTSRTQGRVRDTAS